MIYKDKILKAINEGIRTGFKFANSQKADDSSYVSFDDSKVKNVESLNPIQLNKKFKSLCLYKKWDEANQMIQEYGKGIYEGFPKFEIQSQSLFNMFQTYIANQVENKDNLNILRAIDFSCFADVYFIDSEGNEIDFRDYNNEDVQFIKILTPELMRAKSDIIIDAKTHIVDYANVYYDWQNKAKLQKDQIIPFEKTIYGRTYDFEECKAIAEKDLNGYKRCQKIIDKVLLKTPYEEEIAQYVPAIGEIAKLEKQLGKDNYVGYMPTAGQLKMLNGLCNIVIRIGDLCGLPDIGIANMYLSCWWSSCEFIKNEVFTFHNRWISHNQKQSSFKNIYSFPFYHLEN